MDKLLLGFFADILFQKGILCHEEYEFILDKVKTPEDLDAYTEKMLRGEFNVYKRGEQKPRTRTAKQSDGETAEVY